MKDFDESMDEFEQFKEQYLQYSLISQASQSSQNYHERKTHIKKQNQKQKLKIIPESQNRLNLLTLLNKAKKQKKIHACSGKILGIGDAIFRSNFQCGNIDEIKKLTPHHYEITLEKQTNSNRVSAWFNFICQGLKGQVKFTIKGFTKSSSLYNQGMKICIRDLFQGSKWRRGGTKISYSYQQSYNQYERGSYTLHFTHFFKNQFPNSVEFAYCFPYTFTNLLNFLTQNQKQLKVQSLGTTFEGRQIPLVTIGNLQSDKVIVISSRVHPGETVGSLMMEGLLKKLLSNNQYSELLRQNFLFKIIPMINPDGVVHGNYRFSGAGYDLNRKWKCCSRQIHSEVHYLKQMIIETNLTKKVIMYIDLHGHSRQKNIFFYGCCPKDRTDLDLVKPKQFPFLMSRLHSGIKFQYCSYAVQKQKQGTARVCIWKHLQIPYIYTMEASFLGSDKQNYSISDYESVGGSLCQGICLNFWEYSSLKREELKEEFENKMSQFYGNPTLRQLQFNGNSSDSEPQAGQISESIRKQMKKTKTKKTPINVFKIQEKPRNNKSYAEISTEKLIDTSSNITAKVKKHTELSIKKQMSLYQTKKQKQEDNVFLKTQIFSNIPIDAQEKLKNLFANKRFISQFEDKKSIRRLLDSENKDRINTKKKTVSFEGAQYRRVRKMVQESNKTSQPNSGQRQNSGVVGLGPNNFKEFQKINLKHRGGTMFPTTQTKFKKGISTDSKFRKQKIMQQTMQYRKSFINSADRDVKCTGKQLL